MNDMKRREGFTLVEMLAVMAIISILVAMILGISEIATRKSDQAKAIADIQKIKNILEEYRVEHGAYPAEGDLDDVIEEMDKTFFTETDEIKDPWGKTYIYKKDGKYLISVYSSGPDGDPDTYKDNVGQKNE